MRINRLYTTPSDNQGGLPLCEYQIMLAAACTAPERIIEEARLRLRKGGSTDFATEERKAKIMKDLTSRALHPVRLLTEGRLNKISDPDAFYERAQDEGKTLEDVAQTTQGRERNRD